MSRQNPPKKGKPLKTEPGAIKPINKNNQPGQPRINKLDEIE